MKTLDKYLLWAILYIVGWSIVFFISWCLTEQEPSTLEGCILTPGVVELIACAFIKRGKNGQESDDQETDE